MRLLLEHSRRAKLARITILLALIFVTVAFGGCGDKEGKDALYDVARALHRVANATARADEVTHRLFLDKIISAEEAELISNVLRDINRSEAAFQRHARTYSTVYAQAQADIL